MWNIPLAMDSPSLDLLSQYTYQQCPFPPQVFWFGSQIKDLKGLVRAGHCNPPPHHFLTLHSILQPTKPALLNFSLLQTLPLICSGAITTLPPSHTKRTNSYSSISSDIILLMWSHSTMTPSLKSILPFLFAIIFKLTRTGDLSCSQYIAQSLAHSRQSNIY